MTRRSFLFLAGAGTAGLLLAPSLVAAPKVELYDAITAATVRGFGGLEDIWHTVGYAVRGRGLTGVDLHVAANRAARDWCESHGIVRGDDVIAAPTFERSPHAKPGDKARVP